MGDPGLHRGRRDVRLVPVDLDPIRALLVVAPWWRWRENRTHLSLRMDTGEKPD
jgi:hypothetical protein